MTQTLQSPQPVRPRWPGVSEGLTRREWEVVARLSTGLTNQDIARGMGLSINSIKAYIRSAYRKMGVTSRAQAVMWAVAHGFESDAVMAPSDVSSPTDRSPRIADVAD